MEKEKLIITAHSHIQTLGVDESGIPFDAKNSIIGQEDAREAASLIVEMVKLRKISGRCILLVGPSGTGKTALALAISKELGKKVPFTFLSASEIYSAEVKKSEIIQEHSRMSINIRMKEIKDIFEGEVIEYKVIEEPSKYKKSKVEIKEIIMVLKSFKGTKKIVLSPSLFNSIESEKISVGDIVYVESNSGIVKRLGRSESFFNDTNIESEFYIPLPKGEVSRKREIIQEINLNDLDIANSKPVTQNIICAIKEITKPKKTEISEKLRIDVNKIVHEYLKKGNCEIVPGVLFIDESYLLDLESYSILSKIIESKLSPLIILSTNKYDIENKENILEIPKDFLERLLIINMKKNSKENIKKIVLARLKEEEIEISNEAIDYLCDNFELRYIISILPILNIKPNIADLSYVKEITELFYNCSD